MLAVLVLITIGALLLISALAPQTDVAALFLSPIVAQLAWLYMATALIAQSCTIGAQAATNVCNHLQAHVTQVLSQPIKIVLYLTSTHVHFALNTIIGACHHKLVCNTLLDNVLQL